MRYVLTVDETFEVAGRALLLAPSLSLDSFEPGDASVELKRPDGSRLVADATFSLTHIQRRELTSSSSLQLVVQLDASKADVPSGSEVWLLDSQ